ncbi:unnamed protein product [Trichobilharzia regenti]|nr:unnamed protein product [Trichobilharzia regenti]
MLMLLSCNPLILLIRCYLNINVVHNTNSFIHYNVYITVKPDDEHRLAGCLVPAPLAEDLVSDFVNGHLSWSSPLVIYLRNVTFLSAELIGLSNLSATLSSLSKSTDTNYELICQQFVSFINDIFTCFDHLAQSESCYRVRLNANEYLCIAGYPETRVDHARSCIDLGLNMLKIIR